MADDLTITAGVRTGGGATPNLGALPPDRTNSALETLSGFSKLAGALLAPIIEREKNAAFVEGVTDVMRGRTADQIASEQPGWARVFGDNYAVAGARMQEAASVGTRFVNGVQAQMPELRKLTQEGFSRYVADAMEKDLPTDPQAALLAKQRILQSLPELTGHWSRANVQFQQETALVQHTEAVGAAVGLLKTGEEAKRLNPAVVDPALDDVAWAHFESAMTLPPGVEPKVHDAVLHRSIVGALGTPGGVALYTALKQRGMWDTLPQEIQDRGLTNARQQARQDVQTRMFQEHPELVAETAKLRAEAYKYDVPTLISMADKINDKSAKLMGVPQELWQQLSTSEMETVLRGRDAKLLAIAEAEDRRRLSAAEAEQRRQERARDSAQRRLDRQRERAEDKALEFEEQKANLLAALNDPTPGGFGAHMKTTATPRKLQVAINQDALKRFDVAGVAPGTPEWEAKQTGLATYLTRLVGPGGVEPPAEIENITRLALASSTYTPQVARAIDLISRIQDPSTRARLISGDQKRSMDAYSALVQQHTTVDPLGNRKFTGDRDALWLQAQATAARPPRVSGGEDGQALAEELQKLAGFDTPLMNGILKREYDERHDLPEAERMAAAVSATQGKAYSAGGIVVQLADPSIVPQAGFTKFGGMPPQAQADGMKPLLKGWAEKFKATTPPTVYRAPDRNGEAQFIAIFDTPTGTQTQRFTGQIVREQWLMSNLPASDASSTRQRGKITRTQVYVAPGAQ